MHSKNSLKWSVIILSIVLVSFVVIIFLLKNQTVKSVFTSNLIIPTQTAISAKQVSFGLPVRLSIPSINVNATVEDVGVTVSGEMGIPKGPSEVAWFDLGPRPGEPGSAVISGHYGWKDNIPAVFDNLSKLQPGDKIYVEDDKGTVITFIMIRSQSYDLVENTAKVFGSNDSNSHLNLITCEGIWDPVSKSYSKRLVVFADKEGLIKSL